MNMNILPKYLTIAILSLLFFSCSSNEDDSSEANGNLNNLEVIALNVHEETDEADVLIICNDGSYLLCDAENDAGYTTIHINASVENNIDEGITLYLDKDGTPVMASIKEGRLLFKNITDNSFDFAFIDNNNNISYYWDQPFPYYFNSETRAFYDPLVNAWKSWKSAVWDNHDWEWDEHHIKAAIPFMLKMGSFLITAVDCLRGGAIGGASGIYTFLNEANKSDLINADWVYYASDLVEFYGLCDALKDGGEKFLQNEKLAFCAQKYGLSVLSIMLNDLGDTLLAKLGEYEEMVAPTFDGKEWQIKLSTYLLECSMREGTYTVDVSTKAAWEIDDSNVDRSWCSVSKNNGRIVVNVKKYDGIEDRVCSARIKTVGNETSDIPSATLTIKQSGVLFEISASELVFTQDGGEQGVGVSKNKNVVSWKVSSQPNWCSAKKYGEEALLVTVPEEKHLSENREGVVTLTAELTNGATIDRQLKVVQIVRDVWNNTKWKFTGSVNVSGDAPMEGGFFNFADVTDFGIEIRNVERNDFSLSGDLADVEDKSRIYYDAENRLVWIYEEVMSVGGVNVKFDTKMVFERTNEITATAKLSGSGNIHVPNMSSISYQMNGTFSGKRIDAE